MRQVLKGTRINSGFIYSRKILLFYFSQKNICAKKTIFVLMPRIHKVFIDHISINGIFYLVQMLKYIILLISLINNKGVKNNVDSNSGKGEKLYQKDQ